MVVLCVFLCLHSATAWSLGSLLANDLTDVIFKNKTPQAMKLVNGFSYLAIALGIFLFAPLENASLIQIGLLLLSGVLSSVASIPYYLGLKYEEATGAAIFYQIMPVLYLVADWVIFGQSITLEQILSFLVILAAPIIVVFSRKRPKSRRTEVAAALLFLLYISISVASGLLSTHFGEGLSFLTMLFWYLFVCGLGVVSLLVIYYPWQ